MQWESSLGALPVSPGLSTHGTSWSLSRTLPPMGPSCCSTATSSSPGRSTPTLTLRNAFSSSGCTRWPGRRALTLRSKQEARVGGQHACVVWYLTVCLFMSLWMIILSPSLVPTHPPMARYNHINETLSKAKLRLNMKRLHDPLQLNLPTLPW